MESTTVVIKGARRDKLGTNYARRLRASGQIPAIIYGHKKDPESVALPAHDLGVELLHGARVLHVELDGRETHYLVKAVQYDHLGTTPIHVDLMRVDLHERVTVSVGIELRGTPKGIGDGGMLELAMPSIEVECAVTDIPETLRPSVISLGVGDLLLVKDLEFPPGVKPLADPEDRVAVIRMQVEEAEEEAASEEGGTQPEVIGRVKKDEESSEG